ncbi:hypothetical protein GCM10023063_49680 [Arthrobacter methylotrophus]
MRWSARLAAQTSRYVTTIAPKPASAHRELTLPGTLQGYVESPIYARTSGYVVRWFKDIGAHVNKGDVLALLDTPEVDQETEPGTGRTQPGGCTPRAGADLAHALAEPAPERRRVATGAGRAHECRQPGPGRPGRRRSQCASPAGAAGLSPRGVAPFTGVVTKRNVDVGALVNAGNAGATASCSRWRRPTRCASICTCRRRIRSR